MQESIIHWLSNCPEVKQVHWPAGQIVLYTGQACENLVVVEQGQIAVQRPALDGRMITLYHIDRGQSCVLSSGCILNRQPFPAQAVCLTQVMAFLVPAPRVRQWTRENEHWRSFMFETLSQRLAHLIDLVDSVVFKSLPERLWDWLQANAEVTSETHDSGVSCAIVARTHQQIADELGTSREVVSRLLKKMERAGKLRLQRGRVVLLSY